MTAKSSTLPTELGPLDGLEPPDGFEPPEVLVGVLPPLGFLADKTNFWCLKIRMNLYFVNGINMIIFIET